MTDWTVFPVRIIAILFFFFADWKSSSTGAHRIGRGTGKVWIGWERDGKGRHWPQRIGYGCSAGFLRLTWSSHQEEGIDQEQGHDSHDRHGVRSNQYGRMVVLRLFESPPQAMCGAEGR